nr:hypothetical protein [Deltaproteobacteria bacterium]
MSKDVTFDKLLLEASQYLFQNDLINSRAKINKALSRKPNEPKALALLATILSCLDDRAGAVAIYRVLLSNFPDEPALHFKLGCEYLMLGD